MYIFLIIIKKRFSVTQSLLDLCMFLHSSVFLTEQMVVRRAVLSIVHIKYLVLYRIVHT